MEYSGALSIITMRSGRGYSMYFLQVNSLNFIHDKGRGYFIVADPSRGMTFEFDNNPKAVPGFNWHTNGVAIKVPESDVNAFKKICKKEINNKGNDTLPINKVSIIRQEYGDTYYAYVKY